MRLFKIKLILLISLIFNKFFPIQFYFAIYITLSTIIVLIVNSANIWILFDVQNSSITINNFIEFSGYFGGGKTVYATRMK